jgi:hypothetical protein
MVQRISRWKIWKRIEQRTTRKKKLIMSLVKKK